MRYINITVATEGMKDEEISTAAKEAVSFIQDKYGVDRVVESYIGEPYEDNE